MSSADIIDYLAHELNSIQHKKSFSREDRVRLLTALDQLSLRGLVRPSLSRRIAEMVKRGDVESVRFAVTDLYRNLGPRSRVTSPYFQEMQAELSHLRDIVAEQQSRLEAAEQESEEDEEVSKADENIVEKFNAAKKRMFVIMDFGKDFDDVWNGAIKRACKETKIAPLRVDAINMSSGITDDIEKYVEKSDIVIVDITGNNPNVMYEFGFALGKGKNPILICQKHWAPKRPFDISDMRYLEYEYNWQGIEDLNKGLKKFIEETLKQLKKQKTDKPKAN